MGTLHTKFSIGEKLRLKLKIGTNTKCRICKGTGKVRIECEEFPCPKCKGDGVQSGPDINTEVDAEIYAINYHQEQRAEKIPPPFITYTLWYSKLIQLNYSIPSSYFKMEETELEKLVVDKCVMPNVVGGIYNIFFPPSYPLAKNETCVLLDYTRTFEPLNPTPKEEYSFWVYPTGGMHTGFSLKLTHESIKEFSFSPIRDENGNLKVDRLVIWESDDK